MNRRVLTENGWVRGLPAADPRITGFKGIPYAAKPVGANRWRAPQPCPDWEGELFAADFGPIPMQVNCAGDPETDIYSREWAVDKDLNRSEDCLYLNVWAKADGKKDRPVFVWFFGGGLQVGNTTEMEFDGERLARRDIVVVTVGYRLNVFGFFTHPLLRREAPDAPANFGFLDQKFALQWVSRNIRAFGGDPGNVTIGGQSAGGMSVCAHLTAADEEGLFHRAIIESGSFVSPYFTDFGLCLGQEEMERLGVRLFEALHVSTLEEARALDTETVFRQARDFPGNCWGQTLCRPYPTKTLEWSFDPKRCRCPVMIGAVSNEFRYGPDASNEEDLKALAARCFGDDPERFLSLFSFPADRDSIYRDGCMNAVEFGLRVAARQNAASEDPAPMYGYYFDADIPGYDRPGAFHSVDLWFFFETLAKCWRPFTGKHYDLARNMCDYWANFMRTGDPNGTGSQGDTLPFWPAMTGDEPSVMRFADKPEAGSLDPDGRVPYLLEHYLAVTREKYSRQP